MLILRRYQLEANDAILTALRLGIERPLVCLPTGSGKAACLCTLVHNLSQKFPSENFFITVHTQELIAQLAETYRVISGVKPAVFSASLGLRETGRVMIGQVKSVYKKMCDFGPQKLIVVDECDRIPPEGEGMYRRMLADATLVNPGVRVCGYTATPYRMGSGLVFGKGQPFTDMVYDASITELIKEGYLSPLVSKDGGAPDLTNVHVRQGEFVASELEAAMTDQRLVNRAMDETVRHGADRKGWLIFASGVTHAKMIHEALAVRGVIAPIVTGDTPKDERRSVIEGFKRQQIRALIGVNVLSVGFDAPHADLGVCLRPTLSPGMYYQQLGRLLRIHPGKVNGKILDFSGNILQHGPIDTLNQRIKRAKSAKGAGKAPVKTCATCQEIVPAGVRVCPVCATPFPPLAIAKHNEKADAVSPLSSNKPQTLAVTKVSYTVHPSKDPHKPSTLKVTYMVGYFQNVVEFIAIDTRSHQFARHKALHWLNETPKLSGDRTVWAAQGVVTGRDGDRSTVIETAEQMLPWVSCLAQPLSIDVTKDGQYMKVIRRTFK